MKTIKVKYTFESVIDIQVPDGEDPDMAAEFRGQEEEFKLDGQVSFDYRILNDE